MLISAARLLSWDWTTPQSLEAVDLFKLFSILENLCCYHEADGLVLVTAGFQSPVLWVNLLMRVWKFLTGNRPQRLSKKQVARRLSQRYTR